VGEDDAYFWVLVQQTALFDRRKVSNVCETSTTRFFGKRREKPFCAVGDRGNTASTTQRNVRIPGDVNSKVTICSARCIVSRSARVCASETLLVDDICPTVTGSSLPHSQLTSRVFRTHAQSGDEFTSALNLSHAKIESFHTATLDHVSIRYLILVTILRRHDTLTAPFAGCMTTKYTYFRYTLIFTTK
jgi:hypothetical protein